MLDDESSGTDVVDVDVYTARLENDRVSEEDPTEYLSVSDESTVSASLLCMRRADDEVSDADGLSDIPDTAYDTETAAASRISVSTARLAKAGPTVCSRRNGRRPSRSRLGSWSLIERRDDQTL